MATFYEPDLTGSSPDYLVTNDVYTIFSNSMRIEFNRSIFLSSLTIVVQGTGNVPFVSGTDWTTDNTIDVDYTEMSRMKNIDSSFNATLIKSILITSPMTVPYKISCSYQQLYPVPSKIAVSDTGAVELTPSLILDVLSRLSNVESSLLASQSVLASTQANPRLLPVDVNESIATNLISGEVQTVNVPGGQNVIVPTCGAFYADSVVLTVPGTTTPLVLNTDYILFGADLAKTKLTTNTSGVYKYILMLKQYIGNVNVTYHAFGGDPTLYDAIAMQGELTNISNYLTQTSFLTPSDLGSTAVFLSALNRISSLETSMRNLVNSGSPTYSDVTGNGTSIVTKIRSNDNNLHWWNIASLYQVAGSTDVIIADRMHFRMQLATSHVSADVFVNVDLNLATPFTIDSISVNQDLGYVPFVSYTPSTPVIMPQFRIIYNNQSGVNSGIYLQIGLELTNLAETISIQDLSGSESAWILLPGSSTAILPQDSMVVLPNTTQTWDPSYPNSTSQLHMMPNKTGYLGWGGGTAITALSTQGTVLTALVDTNFVVSDITKFRLVFTAAGDTTHVFSCDIPATTYTGNLTVSGSGPFVAATDGTLSMMEVKLTNTGTTVTLTLTPSSVPTTSTLSLRHILLMFD